MDFEKQKPVTDEYRENWDRLYATFDHGIAWHPVSANTMLGIDRSQYPNGCPILSETLNA